MKFWYNRLMLIKINKLSKKDIELVGGKAANLGELFKIDMPVPNGFVVTTKAYQSFIEKNKLQKLIKKDFTQTQAKNLRKEILKSKIPPEIKEKIIFEYNNLQISSVAVRSSATSEDLDEAAFAGQQDTFLNIIEEKNLLKSIKKTWASLWSDRAITYRKKQGFDNQKVKIAVIIQEMVQSDYAGVLFTANPLNGNRDEVIIDANPGLGEAVVSGLVTPESYLLKKGYFNWKIEKTHDGKKELIITANSKGGIKELKNSNSNVRLNQESLKKLADYCQTIQNYFKKPQDIEWAIKDKEVKILQSRPITSLPKELPKQNSFSRLIASLIAEVIVNRPLPLESTIVGPKLLIEKLFAPLISKIGLEIPQFTEIFEEKNGILVSYKGTLKPKPTPAILLAPYRLIKPAIKYNPHHWKDDQILSSTLEKISEYEEKIKTYKKRSVQPTEEELIENIEESLNLVQAIMEIRLRYIPRIAFSLAILKMAPPRPSRDTLASKSELSTRVFERPLKT